MKVLKAYKFRLYPNKEQEILINKAFGCARLVYNIMLAKKKENKNLDKYDLMKEIPKLYNEYPFLKEVDSMSLRNTVSDLINGYDKFYNKKGGYPKFKQKGIKESYRTNMIRSSYKGKVYENIKLDLEKRIILLPKLKEIQIRGYRNLKEIKGRIINATIKKEAYKYYVSVIIEEEQVVLKNKKRTAIGIDVGVKSIVTTSDGETFGNPRYQEKYDKRIKRLQKSLSRKEKNSNNYKKAKIKLQEVYRKLKNARKKLVEEIVSKVTKYNDIIIAENLKVKKMLEKKKSVSKRLRKEIVNSTFGLILRKLEAKCKVLNKVFYQVDTYYASSQICSRCGNKKEEMKDLSKREYKCDQCGIELDRDINASINILYEGICMYYKKKYNN